MTDEEIDEAIGDLDEVSRSAGIIGRRLGSEIHRLQKLNQIYQSEATRAAEAYYALKDGNVELANEIVRGPWKMTEKVAVAVFVEGVTASLSPDLDEVQIQIGSLLKRMSPADARTLADAIVALADSVQK